MTIDAPQLDGDSPLESIARSRISVASASSEYGILDAFPLPDSIPQPSPSGGASPMHPVYDITEREPRGRLPEPESHNIILRGSLVSSPSSEAVPGAGASIAERPDEMNSMPGKAQKSHAARAKWWRIRRGNHQRGKSLQDGAAALLEPHNADLERPRLVRTHSTSRSWDAGLNFDFSTSSRFTRLPSGRSHVKMGSQAAGEHDYASAKVHWLAAADEPWNSELAKLLLQLGFVEEWFSVPEWRVPNFSSIDPQAIRELTPPITSVVVEALMKYAARLKMLRREAESLRCHELAGELGSRESALTVAELYARGSRSIKRDIAKAQRWFERVNESV